MGYSQGHNAKPYKVTKRSVVDIPGWEFQADEYDKPMRSKMMVLLIDCQSTHSASKKLKHNRVSKNDRTPFKPGLSHQSPCSSQDSPKSQKSSRKRSSRDFYDSGSGIDEDGSQTIVPKKATRGKTNPFFKKGDPAADIFDDECTRIPDIIYGVNNPESQEQSEPESESARTDSEDDSDDEENGAPSITLAGKRIEQPSTPDAPSLKDSKCKVKPAPIFAPLFRTSKSSQSSQSSQPSSQESTTTRGKHQDRKGCIYVFHDDESGHVKIGMSLSVRKRLGEVRNKCRKPHLTLEWQTGDSIPWDELQRLEKIVHWDLSQFNRRYHCHCGYNHTEWFDVEIKEAKRTIEMWLRYQRLRPDVTCKDLERLKTGFPKERGATWMDVLTTDHLKRIEFWHSKLFGEIYDESFCED